MRPGFAAAASRQNVCGIRPSLLLSTVRQSRRTPILFRARCSVIKYLSSDAHATLAQLKTAVASRPITRDARNIRIEEIRPANDAIPRATSNPALAAASGGLRQLSALQPRAVRLTWS